MKSTQLLEREQAMNRKDSSDLSEIFPEVVPLHKPIHAAQPNKECIDLGNE